MVKDARKKMVEVKVEGVSLDADPAPHSSESECPFVWYTEDRAAVVRAKA